MKKTIDFAIGKKLPLDILMQPVFLGANRGWGKTSCAKALYEAGHDAGAQCITVAPAGKWWSLRLAENGKDVGLEDVFVFGGPHGDVPLTPESGAVVAKLLVEKRIHAVLDVSLMRKGQRARFLADLFEEFWLLKKMENDSYPVVVFIEEAHAVAPQKPQPEEARMLGAIEDIATEGRNHGIGIVFLDPRAARVNKNVLALVEVLIVGRVIHPLDLKANGDWVTDKGAEDRSWLKELPSLEAGEAYIYAPLLGIFERVRLRMPRTFNATKTAKIGERVVKAGALTQVDISGLKESMSQVIAEAEKNDPRALKLEIARLKGELAKKPAAAPAAATKTVEVPVSIKEELRQLQHSIEVIAKIGDQLAQKQQVVVSALHNATTILKPTFDRPMQKLEVRPPPGVVVRAPRAAPAHPAAALQPAEGLSGKATEMLRELVAALPGGLTRPNVAMRVGLRYNRNFRNYQSELNTAGLVDVTDAQLIANEAGQKLIGTAQLKTASQLREMWRPLLSGKANGMLDALLENGGPMTREDLAASVELGYNRNFRNYQSELSTAGLVAADRLNVRASLDLFMGGA